MQALPAYIILSYIMQDRRYISCSDTLSAYLKTMQGSAVKNTADAMLFTQAFYHHRHPDMQMFQPADTA